MTQQPGPTQFEYSQALEAQWSMLEDLTSGETGQILKSMFKANNGQGPIYLGQKATDTFFAKTADFITSCLAFGDTFYWATQLCDLLEKSSENLPDFTMTADLLPSPYGFLYFGRYLKMPQMILNPIFDVLTRPSDHNVRHHDDPNNKGSLHTDEPLHAISWGTMTSYVEGEEIGQTVGSKSKPNSAYNIPEGSKVHSVTEVNHVILSAFARSSIRFRYGQDRLSLTVPFEQGTTVSKLQTRLPTYSDEWTTQFLKYVGTAFLFMKQRIMVDSAQVPGRGTRKRLHGTSLQSITTQPDGTRKEPIVRIVHLRKREQDHSNGKSDTTATQPHEVDWSCQWVVSGHWRNQYYPSTSLHQPKYIVPYIKGPTDKPLKPPSKTVFMVDR